ncbi:MAG: AtpZ/AtpI family protein [Alphaproteobacteria bacterium]
MNEDKPTPEIDLLDARIAEARNRDSGDGNGADMAGFGAAMRYGTELVAGLIVGVGVGLLLDNWLDTGPWFLVVFFFLGAGAGILNVYRTASGIGLASGYKEPGMRPGEQNDTMDDK